MNERLLRFSIVQYQPHLERQELVNVGVCVFERSKAHLVLATNQGKLLALDPNFNITRVFEEGHKFSDYLSSVLGAGASPEEIAESGFWGPLALSPVGQLVTHDLIENVAEELLQELVVVPAVKRFREPRVSTLNTELRQLFRRAGILGTQPSDIARHKIVPAYPIDPDVGLYAEFALRNGKLHVTETVDFRTNTPSGKRQEAQAKTLVLVQAKQTVGTSDIKRYVVVSGATASVQSSINLLERHTEELIVRESAEDWRRYVDAMHTAANPTGGLVH